MHDVGSARRVGATAPLATMTLLASTAPMMPAATCFSFLSLGEVAAVARTCTRWSEAVDAMPSRCDEWTLEMTLKMRVPPTMAKMAHSRLVRHIGSLLASHLPPNPLRLLTTILRSGRCAALTQLRIGNTRMFTEDAIDLAHAIVDGGTITSVDLSGCGLGSRNARALAPLSGSRALRSLNLANNDIDADGARGIAHMILASSTIAEVDLSGNAIDTADGVAPFAACIRHSRSLTTLRLGGGIGDDGACILADALRDSRAITHLDLSGSEIRDSGAIALARGILASRTVLRVDLDRNWITTPGAIALSECIDDRSSVVRVGLTFNPIGSVGVLAFAASVARRTALLDLRGAGSDTIDETTTRKLAGLISESRTLATFDLRQNTIDDASAVALARAIEDNRTLTHVDLACNQIGREGVTALVDAFDSRGSPCVLTLSDRRTSGDRSTDVSAVGLATAIRRVSATRTGTTAVDLLSLCTSSPLALADAIESNGGTIIVGVSEDQLDSDDVFAIVTAAAHRSTRAVHRVDLSANQGRHQLYIFGRDDAR